MVKTKQKFFFPGFIIGLLALLWLAAEYKIFQTSIPIGPFGLLAVAISFFILTKE
ncbi:MAG: hypothetical protein ACK4J0_01945 [Candidatus Anstonellaceae archaeon]